MMYLLLKNHQIIQNDNFYSRSFFESDDVVQLAKELLGTTIISSIGPTTKGIIIETEAYRAPEDKASHAFNNRRTSRTETMFGPPGSAYVYLCYGIHHLFNIVTGPKETPHAILIRAVQPLDGIETMKKRRNIKSLNQLTNGPGKWTQAFGITTAFDALDLLDQKSNIQIFPPDPSKPSHSILATPRIGIDYAKEWKNKPWRFVSQ